MRRRGDDDGNPQNLHVPIKICGTICAIPSAAGMREFRNMGDELARQGRLRMDIFQTERRLRCALKRWAKRLTARLNQNLT